MREILFRGKMVGCEEWVYGDLRHSCVDKIPFIEDWTEQNHRYYAVYPETIGQFTGLCDKNGKRIFEGDILEYNDGYDYFKGSVVFEYGAFGIGTHEVIGLSSCCYDNFANLWQLFWDQGVTDEPELYYCKIIGNIHDNPELLKGE